MKWLVSSLTVNDIDLQDIHELLLTWCQASQSMIKKTVSQHQAIVRFWINNSKQPATGIVPHHNSTLPLDEATLPISANPTFQPFPTL